MNRLQPFARAPKFLAKLLLAVLLSLGLTLGLSAAPASAKTTTVSTKYTAPKYGQTNSGVTALQRRLVKAGALKSSYVTGYYGSLTRAAVSKFQKKNKLKATGKVDKLTWTKLVAKTGKITVKSTPAPSKASASGKSLPKACRTGRVMCIDKTSDKLRWVINGKVKQTMDARFGCARTATRNGSFRVFQKSYNHTSSIYHTWMPRAMFFSGGQAVHYSPDFKARGYKGCSHGCVNIRDWAGINKLYKAVKVGDKVVVYRS